MNLINSGSSYCEPLNQDAVFMIFFFNDTATTEIYTLSLHDALPISHRGGGRGDHDVVRADGDVLLVKDVGDGGTQDVDRGRLPVDRDLDGLVVVGDTDRTGGHGERGSALSGMTKRSREQHKCSRGRAPRAPASDVSRGRPGPRDGEPAWVLHPPDVSGGWGGSHVSSEANRPRPFPPPCRTSGAKVKFR